MPRLVLINGEKKVVVQYTNYRGETSNRRIEVAHVWYGATQWHTEPQWFAMAWDCDKREYRDFALKDMRPVDG